MKTTQIIGLSVLIVIWGWLCVILMTRGGITPYNITVIIFSGIIIFVPLYRKYVRPWRDNKKRS